MPNGGEHGKASYEFALNHIGWSVGVAFGIGSVRGFIGELMNRDTARLVSYFNTLGCSMKSKSYGYFFILIYILRCIE